MARTTILHEYCPTCNELAVELFSFTTVDKDGNDVRLVTLKCHHVTKYIIPKDTPFHEFITYEHRNNGCVHTWDKIKCTSCGANRLYEFQCEGARFLEQGLATGRGAAIFDEMGLGKTVQPMAYFNYHPESFPVLFIVKSGLKFQFFKTIHTWLGPDYMAQMISTGKDYVFPGLKCYIIAFDLLRRFPREKLESLGIKTVVIDECQQIKNPNSTRTQEVRRVVANIPHVIPLSGTPWKNRGGELYTVLNMLAPAKFPSEQGFMQDWVDWYHHGAKIKQGGIKDPGKFKEYVKDIVIRRERINVMKELPAISRNKLHVQLDTIEQKQYDEAVSEFVKWFNQVVINGEEDTSATATNMLAQLARMRHITGLAKIPFTVDFASDFIHDTGRKLLIGVHHKDVGQILIDRLKAELPHTRLFKITGDMTPEQRFDQQEYFNKTESCVMVASILAAGEGLNLQTCSDCVLHERQWNPANEEQFEGRLVRIGQLANAINATYVEAEGTVDQHLDNIVEPKRIAFHNAMNNSTMTAWNQSDIMSELARAVVASSNKAVEAGRKTISQMASLGKALKK